METIIKIIEWLIKEKEECMHKPCHECPLYYYNDVCCNIELADLKEALECLPKD